MYVPLLNFLLLHSTIPSKPVNFKKALSISPLQIYLFLLGSNQLSEASRLSFDPMATGVSVASIPIWYCFGRNNLLARKPISQRSTPCFVLASAKKRRLVMEKRTEHEFTEKSLEQTERRSVITPRVAERLARRKSERNTYLVAAIMSSLGVTSAAAMAVYYRFSWQTEIGEFLVPEMLGTFLLSVGSAVGMEFWARWAHRALWHASLWQMHEGLGITVFGMAYMFVHDGLVHRRFPVGPIADVPYLQRVAAAHQVHHSYILNGVPYGLFLGPKEIEEVGGMEELEKEIKRRSTKSTIPKS